MKISRLSCPKFNFPILFQWAFIKRQATVLAYFRSILQCFNPAFYSLVPLLSTNFHGWLESYFSLKIPFFFFGFLENERIVSMRIHKDYRITIALARRLCKITVSIFLFITFTCFLSILTVHVLHNLFFPFFLFQLFYSSDYLRVSIMVHKAPERVIVLSCLWFLSSKDENTVDLFFLPRFIKISKWTIVLTECWTKCFDSAFYSPYFCFGTSFPVVLGQNPL